MANDYSAVFSGLKTLPCKIIFSPDLYIILKILLTEYQLDTRYIKFLAGLIPVRKSYFFKTAIY